ncbi:MAG: single-stranded DNA-binding protein [Steroidobacteraceae bacterium]
MSSVNKATIVGRLGRDPDSKTLPSGDVVTNCSIATDETWKDKAGEKQQRTTWWNVSFWGRLAEIAAEYLVKGSLVYVEGTVSVRAYTNRQGEAGASLELRARELKMLSSKPRDGAEESAGAEGTAATREPIREPAQPAPREEFDDDIPF